MENSALLELLKTFSSKELKAFSAYLNGDYPPKRGFRAESIRLFETVARTAPKYESDSLKKENVFRRIFGDEPFSIGKLEKVMVELLKIVKSFLLTERYFQQENELAASVDFAQILVERRLPRKSTILLQSIETKLNEIKSLTANEFLIQYRVSCLFREIHASENTWRKDLNIGDAIKKLDLFYSASRLPLLNHYLLLKKIGAVNSHIDLEKESQKVQLLGVSENESPSVFIMQKVFELYSSPSDIGEAISLSERVDILKSKMSIDDVKNFYSYLRSYLTSLINQGRTELWSNLYEIQKNNLSDGYYYADGKISPGSYFNIAHAAIRAKDFSWANDFIETHKSTIIGNNETNDFYRLTKAYYHFHDKKHELALDILPSASTNLDFHFLARRLELMIYFETKSDLLQYKIDAFKMYLSRGRNKQISEGNYEANNHFLNVLIQLSQSMPGDLTRSKIILDRIEQKKHIILKDWLIEKAKELAFFKRR